MFNLTVTGNLGRDAEYKETQNGNGFCSFSVAGAVGYGDNKKTIWVDVTRFGKGAEGLTRILRKGSSVAVSGEFDLYQKDDKAYVKCRADSVTILSTPRPDDQRVPDPNNRAMASAAADLDDEIPF